MSQKKNDAWIAKVFEVVRKVPAGKVTTYGAIATYLGMTHGARMVGWAMNQSHFSTHFVPAHRVVNSTGLLTGKHHFAFSTTMQELLEAEGVSIRNDKVVDFKKHLWLPAKELDE